MPLAWKHENIAPLAGNTTFLTVIYPALTGHSFLPFSELEVEKSSKIIATKGTCSSHHEAEQVLAASHCNSTNIHISTGEFKSL